MMKTTTINQKLNLNEIKDWLKENLNDERYRHTLGVADCAKELALKFGVNPDKAYLAGLLHDCAKSISSEDKLEYCKKYGMPVSEYEQKNPELLHAKLGACFANTKYGVSDP